MTIEHRAAESVVHVTSGSASYTLHTYSPEDFPRLPEIDAVETFSVDRESLLETITRVARAASRDESRPVLTGVLVQFTERPARDGGDGLVPARRQADVARRAPCPSWRRSFPAARCRSWPASRPPATTVGVGVHENQVLFSTDGVWLTTRRIDGQFPNYRQLLPEAFEYELRIPRADLLDVVRRASVMIQRATPLQLRFAEGELTVIARTHEVGESKESLPVGFTGETLEIGFNADFLREGLESLDGDEVRFKLISPLRPAVIQGDGDDFTYLVMPIRLPG